MRTKSVSISDVEDVLSRSRLSAKAKRKVLEELASKKLPSITRHHIKSMRIFLKRYGVVALTVCRASGKVLTVHPKRVRISDGRVEHLRKLALERKKKSGKVGG